MQERGWGSSATEIRQAQLIEWLVPQSSSATYVSVKPPYDAQPGGAHYVPVSVVSSHTSGVSGLGAALFRRPAPGVRRGRPAHEAVTVREDDGRTPS
jgi:hypothetical protein